MQVNSTTFTPKVWKRFWAKVDVLGPYQCWKWKAHVGQAGYGLFRYQYTHVRPHRMSYEMLVGEIPEGLQIDHLCYNRACVNPRHLEPVTAKENTRRAFLHSPQQKNHQTLKTHCPQGHPYSQENTYRRPNKTSRKCRTCGRAATRLWTANTRNRSSP